MCVWARVRARVRACVRACMCAQPPGDLNESFAIGPLSTEFGEHMHARALLAAAKKALVGRGGRNGGVRSELVPSSCCHPVCSLCRRRRRSCRQMAGRAAGVPGGLVGLLQRDGAAVRGASAGVRAGAGARTPVPPSFVHAVHGASFTGNECVLSSAKLRCVTARARICRRIGSTTRLTRSVPVCVSVPPAVSRLAVSPPCRGSMSCSCTHAHTYDIRRPGSDDPVVLWGAGGGLCDGWI
jgi:hypothetical protein